MSCDVEIFLLIQTYTEEQKPSMAHIEVDGGY
jgi:hypothetical protein